LFLVHTKPVLMKVFLFFGCSCLISVATWLSVRTEVPAPMLAEVPAVVEESLPPAPLLPADPPGISPLDGQRQVTSAFGPRIHPVLKEKQLHRGIDFKAPMGTPILATADGTITFASEEQQYGLKVVI